MNGARPMPCGALVDQIPAGIVSADRRERVSYANRTALETLGLAPDECLGRPVSVVFGAHAGLQRALETLAPGEEARLDFHLAQRDGRHLELGMTVVRCASDAPPALAFLLLFRDLADRRQFEMELRRSERQQAIGNVVSGFAHEVRNPLAGIQALAEVLLAESPQGDLRREYVERMLGLLERVEQLVRASLRFGDPRPPSREAHDPAVLVEQALGALESRWAGYGERPALTLARELPRVEADGPHVVEALVELLENALESAGDPARVEARVWSGPGEDGAGRQVRFEVCDRGPGIPDALLSRIFDPFFTTKPKGVGLGLAVAQTLARENWGRLLVRSRPGVETVFTLVLPEAGG